MDELLNKAAAKMGMPPALAMRSAEARATKEGTTVEAVLAEWAGEDTSTGDAAPEDAAAVVASEADVPTDAPEPSEPPASAAPSEVTSDYLVQLAAHAKRMPPKLVRSSAEARARNSQTDVDVVLATWAGYDLDDLRERAAAGNLPAVAPQISTPATPTPAPQPTADPAPAAAAETEPAAPSPAAPIAAAAAAMSVDELLDKAAAAKGMPAPLAKRSAQARATKEGTTLEAVLAEWAGVDPTVVSSAPAATSEAAAPEPASAPAAAPVVSAAAAMSVDELLDKAAAAKGMPAPLAKRSAQARATKEGTTLEAVLAEWAGVDPTVVSSAPAATSEAPVAAEAPADPQPPAPSDDVEVIEASAGGTAAEPLDPGDAPMRPRRSGYPTWLAAAFVIIPLLAVTYILVSPNGPDCGTAGQLKVDPVTGLAVNCDGSEFGGSSVDFFSQGAGIYAQCAACHGANGGGGVGPAFTGGAVLATFPACTDHVVWVTLGTANFPDPTYGATNKPVGGGGLMPGYEGALTEEQIASVSLYERVTFGGQPLEEAEIDCGLVEGEGDGTEGGDEMVEASP